MSHTSKRKLKGDSVLRQNTLIVANIFLSDVMHHQGPLAVSSHILVLLSYFHLSSIPHPDHLKANAVNIETIIQDNNKILGGIYF